MQHHVGHNEVYGCFLHGHAGPERDWRLCGPLFVAIHCRMQGMGVLAYMSSFCKSLTFLAGR